MKTDLPTDAAALRALLLAEQRRCQAAEAEVARLQAQQFLASIPRLNPNPVLRLNADGKLLFANPAAGPLAREWQAAEVTPVRRQLMQAAQQALRTGSTAELELLANGQCYLLFTVPVVDEACVLLYLTDVTARRKAEQEVHQQREFYETILANLPAVVTVLDPDQRYLYINDYATDSPEERRARLGTTFVERCTAKGLPPELAVRRRRLFERAVRTRVLVNWEERWPDPDGTPQRYWLCYYQPVFGASGELRMVLNYGFDITTQRQAEARTRQSESELQAQQAFTGQLLDLNPNVIWVRDARARNTFENARARTLREQVRRLAGTATMEQATEVDTLKTAAYADQQVLRTGQPLTIENVLRLATGEVRWFQTVRCPITMPDGSCQVLGVSADITELKVAQHAAEAAATARENFLANMSHEIRTPLNGVLGMTNLLAKTDLNEQQRSYTAVVQYSGRHLLSVVNDVLDMAKITSGKLEMEQAVFDLCDSMGNAAAPLVLQAQEKGITVVGTLLRESCPLPWVIGDSHRLNQVLLNLLSNAIKFTPAGGTITVGGYFVDETADTLTTEFRVTDTGMGIAPDKLESIFQEFTQAYADTTRQFGGTGLGLSISRALVTHMGGRLMVESAPRQGSSFSFITTLPKASPEARRAAQAPAAPMHEAAVHGRRVLLVEDNAVNREVAQLLLESHGVLIDEASSGIEALALFEQHRYDAVLMDIQMPGMNGLEATARIRASADPARAATPILALTANAFRADAEKYRAAGMNDTLAKPFDEAELLNKLAKLIGEGNEGAPARPAAKRPPRPAPAKAPPLISSKSQPYDLTLLRTTAHGSLLFMNRILASFQANTPESIDDLRAAYAAASWQKAAAVAHKLRPSLCLLGAESLVPWLDALEAKTGTKTARLAATERLAAGLADLLAALPTTLTE